MSSIGQVTGGWDTLKNQLPHLFIKYHDELDQVEDRLALTGKTMERALKDQGQYPIKYADQLAELKTLNKYVGLEIGRVRGRLFKQITERHSIDLSDRAKDKIIDTEPEYLQYAELQLEIQELLDKTEAVVNAFTTRGFALRDITQLKINQLANSVL